LNHSAKQRLREEQFRSETSAVSSIDRFSLMMQSNYLYLKGFVNEKFPSSDIVNKRRFKYLNRLIEGDDNSIKNLKRDGEDMLDRVTLVVIVLGAQTRCLSLLLSLL
jgi:hypothetical protein